MMSWFRTPAAVPARKMQIAPTAVLMPGGKRFERTASQILPNLYLSDAMTARWGDTLDRLKVTHVLCVMEEPVTYPRTNQDLKILHIPVSDDPTSDLLSYFECATEFITEAIGTPVMGTDTVNTSELEEVKEVKETLETNTQPFPSPGVAAADPNWEVVPPSPSPSQNVVLVHCLAGMSRSATIVIAYLLATTSMNTPEAIVYVRSRRPIISPNYGFERQLRSWETKHFVATRKRRVSNKAMAFDFQSRLQRYKDAAAGRSTCDDTGHLVAPSPSLVS